VEDCLIVAAYTPGRYADLARECVKAWSEFGVDVKTIEYPDGGSWHRNILGFTIAVAPLWTSDEPLFVIGVDSLPSRYATPERVHAELARLADILKHNDVVCEHRPCRQLNMKVHSGIVGWAPSARPTFERYVDILKAERDLPPYRNDQEILYGILIDMEARGGSWYRLPDGYNCKDLDNPLALFVHGHASRRADVA
jgi:hypothetical protein